MDPATRLRKALEPVPPGSLVPVEWVRGFLEGAEEDRLGDYTVEDAAGILNRAPSTIRSMIGDGRLRAYRFGREWRITAEAIRELRSGGQELAQGGEAEDLGAWRRVREEETP